MPAAPLFTLGDVIQIVGAVISLAGVYWKLVRKQDADHAKVLTAIAAISTENLAFSGRIEKAMSENQADITALVTTTENELTAQIAAVSFKSSPLL